MFTRLPVYVFLWAINSFAVGDINTVAITLPTFVLCLFNISRIRDRYLTTADMFWFVYFIFFVIGPIQTLSDNYFRKEGPVFGIYFLDGEIYTAAAIAFLFALAATVVGVSSRRTKRGPYQTINYSLDSNRLLLLIPLLLASFAAVIVFSGGLGNLLAARAEKDQDALSVLRVIAIASQLVTSFLILSIFMRGRTKEHSLGYLPFVGMVLALCLLAVAQNPYNTPRYFLLQSWMPVLLLLMGGRLRIVPFYAACLFGMLVLLPVFSLTSRFGVNLTDAIQNVDLSEDFFHLPYVDVFDMLVYAVRYVGDFGLSYGSRTLGALLFFIPRALWTGKPELIALQMGEELVAMRTAGTENLSLFFGGEFYADFGLLGVGILGFLFCWMYLRLVHQQVQIVNGFRIKDFVIISAIPIVLRGPIGATASLIFITMIFLVAYLSLFARR